MLIECALRTNLAKFCRLFKMCCHVMFLQLPARIIRNRHLLKYCGECLFDLSLAKFLVLFVPFNRWKRSYGYFQCESLKNDVACYRQELFAIRRSIQCVAKCVPWRSKCLDQAMAAQRMLKRRGLSSTLYFGMVKDQEKKWLAHAWVRCGDQWLIGYYPSIPYTVVGTYAWLA